jgi:hypothetical protein
MKGEAGELLGPIEGLPPYLMGPVLEWVGSRFYEPLHRTPRSKLATAIQLVFRLDEPLDDGRHEGAIEDLLSRMRADEGLALDVVDYVLHNVRGVVEVYEEASEVVHDLDMRLELGGSVWEVSAASNGAYQLSRRAVGPVRDVIGNLVASDRAHSHLMNAWDKLAGRHPDPSAAYREAIRAVEAAAKPVIAPKDQLATLGKMIRALGDKPEKWTTTLGTVEDVKRQMESVWKGQLDRHGTDDGAVPVSVSAEESDAAFHVCLTLVRLFVGGHVRDSSS